MATDQIERETTIAAPVERVWAVLTEADHITSWFTGGGTEIELRPGGPMLLQFAEHGSVRARVEAVEPPHRFAYRWTAHHAAKLAEPEDGNSTLVEFTLTPEGDGTRLRVVETGFASLDTSEEQRRGNYEANVGGWKEMLGRVAEYAQRVTV
jgi:uncharacterized protein YndB with AHSA1/START domain